MKHPLYNALAATFYITVLVSFMFYVLDYIEHDGPEFVMPIIMLSLFVLSAAVMGYLFLAEPLMLYLNGRKKEAINFFLRTVVAFASITIILIASRLLINTFL